MKRILSIAAMLLFTLSIYAQDATQEQVKEEISNNLAAMGRAMQNGDPAGLAAYFTEDTYFKLPGQPAATSRMAVEKIHKKMLSEGMGIRPMTQEVTVSNDMAVELGTVDMLKEGKVVGKAHYLTLWKKTDDGWKIYRDMVSAAPATGQ